MWNSVPLLQAIAAWSLTIALVAGLATAAAGFIATITSNRASTLVTREADERIAVANQRAMEARLQTEQLRARVAWRRVTRQQAATLAEALRGFDTTFTLQTVKNDPEAVLYWTELSEALRAAGVDVKAYTGGWARVTGVHVDGADEVARDRLVRALISAGVRIAHVGTETQGTNRLRVIIGTNTGGLEISEEAHGPAM